MKTSKKLVSIIMTIAVLLGITSNTMAAVVNYGSELTNMPSKSYTQKFGDVPTSYWAFEYITEMADRSVLSGYPDGKFYPNNNVTRAEFAKIMATAAGLSIGGYYDTGYEDVSYDNWATPYINAAKYYLSGYVSNGLKYYQPNNNALREDIAVALVKLKGYSIAGYDLSIIQTMFTDWQSISSSAQPYVAVAVEQGLISGYDDRTFKGQQGITRAEAATLLWRAYQYGNDNKVYEPEVMEKEVIEATPTPTPEQVVEETETVVDNDTDNEDIDYSYTEPVGEENPKPEYGWKVSTIKNGVDDMLFAQTVPNGLSYMQSYKDGKIYEVNNNGKVTVIFDVNEFPYVGEEEVSRFYEPKNNLICYGYNNYDNCYYVIVKQDSYNILYNVTNDKIITRYRSSYNVMEQVVDSVDTPLKFMKNGDFQLAPESKYEILITPSGNIELPNNPINPYMPYIIVNNDVFVLWGNFNVWNDKLGLYIDTDSCNWYNYYGIIGNNKFYGYTYDNEIFSLSYTGDIRFLLSFDDIENEEGRKIDPENVIGYGSITDDENIIYFYDNAYGSIRKIERQ